MICNKPMSALGVFLLVFFMTGITQAATTNQTTHNAVSAGKTVTPAPVVIPVVDYNPTSDQLTVNVTGVSLHEVLAAIAGKSGIQVLMDPAIKQTVSARFEKQKLIKGLQQLLRNTNSAFFFNEEKNKNSHKGNQLLLAIKILPKGQHSSDSLRPLISLRGEAVNYERNKRNGRKSGYAASRWQARQQHMPKTVSKKLEKFAKQRLAKEAKRKEKAAKRKAERKAKREKMKQKRLARQAAIDKELKTNHPELYEERQRIRAEGRLRAQRERDERGILNFGR